MSAEAVQATRARKVGRVIFFLVLLLALWSLLLRGCTRLCDVKPVRIWTASSGEPVSSDWKFLGFPASASVKLFDAPDGNEVDVLQRAVGVSLEEERSEWVGVYPNLCVRRSDLTLTPPINWRELLAVYCDLQRQVGHYGFVNARLETVHLPDQRLQVNFSEKAGHDSTTEFRYTVEGGRGVPQEAAVLAVEGLERGLRAIWVVPLTIGLCVILTKLLAWCFFRDKPTRKYSLDAHCFGAAKP
jgi:hypothetical protein